MGAVADVAAQLFGKALHNGQSQAGVSASLSAGHGLEKFGARDVGKARAVISDCDFHVLAAMPVDQILGGHRDSAARSQGFNGVAYQVEQDLADGVAAARQRRKNFCQIQVEADPTRPT